MKRTAILIALVLTQIEAFDFELEFAERCVEIGGRIDPEDGYCDMENADVRFAIDQNQSEVGR